MLKRSSKNVTIRGVPAWENEFFATPVHMPLEQGF